MQTGWSGWRKVSGLICGKKIAAQGKGKVYKKEVGAVVLFSLETVALTKRTGGRTRGGTVKDVEILLGVTSIKDKERAHQRDGTGQMFWRQS